MFIKKSKRNGFNAVHIFVLLVVVASLLVGFKIYKAHQKKVQQEQQEALKAEAVKNLVEKKKIFLSIVSKWDDALRLAKMTSRIALTQPLSQMQAIRREMNELKANECFDKAIGSAVAGMGDAIFAFEMFIRYPSNDSASESTSKYLATSSQKIDSAIKSVDFCISHVN